MASVKIGFLNPPFLKNFSRPQRSPAVTKSGTLYFPMWLAYAVGYAEQEGYEVDLVDAPAAGMGPKATLDRLCRFAPQLLVVETSTPSIYNDVQFCEEVKQHLPDVLILLTGTHVSALPEETLKLNLAPDGIALGEYDITIKEVADALAGKKEISSVPGLCLRRDNGLMTTPERGLLTDLDILPMVSPVYQKFLDIRNYFNPNALFPMVTITTSRGCPHRCIFCVYPQAMMGHRLRTRSVENVVAEIEYIIDHFPKAKSIFFEDDTFPANKKRCLAICRRMVEKGLKISWTTNARADLDLETMQAMKDAGCRCLCVGFESGNQGLLDTIKKGITVEQMELFMENSRKTGMLIHGCFIVGHPGETAETMQETLDLAIRLKPESAQFYPVMVYPGTEAYRWYESHDQLLTNDFSQWLTETGLHNTVIRGEELSGDDLVAFCDMARRAFYLRPRYLVYKLVQVVTTPSELKRNLKSVKTFFKFLVFGTDRKSDSCS